MLEDLFQMQMLGYDRWRIENLKRSALDGFNPISQSEKTMIREGEYQCSACGSHDSSHTCHKTKAVETYAKFGEMQASEAVRHLSTKEMVIERLKTALMDTQGAYNIAVRAHPIAADIPVFQRMQQLSRELQDMMMQIQKLRGL